MTAADARCGAETARQTLILRLNELLAALDRRIPCMEHAAEQRIARDSAVLRKQARKRIAELESEQQSRRTVR